MSNSPMNRKRFLTNLGKCCVGSWLFAAMSSFEDLQAQDKSEPTPPEKATPRAQERIEFAEKWVKRFFDILDGNVDKQTREKIMMANGKGCFQNWIKETGQQIRPTTLEKLKAWAEKNATDGSLRVEGNDIYYQFMQAAETGLPSEEGACLCTLVETKPAGLSGTYCLCSVGYVQEWYSQLLARPVTVELMESVLMGGKRCKFKISVA
jgi:predicted hydrocarbon binding protein